VVANGDLTDPVFLVDREGDVTVRGTTVSLPNIPTAAATDDVLRISPTGEVRRSSASGLISGLAWALTGNGITSAWNGSSGNFLGTTNAQPLVIATTSTAPPQPIQFWTNNVERMRITATGEVVVQNQAAGAPTTVLQVLGGNNGAGATKVIIEAGASQGLAGVNLLEWVDEFGITQGVIDAGGLVGIGTTTPVQKLHVDGRGSVSAVFVEGGVGVGTVRPLATLHVYDEGTLTPGATQVVIQAGTNQSGVDLLQWQNNSGDPLGVIRPDGSVVLVYAPPARQAFFGVAKPLGELLIGIGPEASGGWGVGVYDDLTGQLRAGMGKQSGEWRMGVGDLAAQNGVLLSWVTGAPNEPRIVVANGNLTTPVFLVDREGDVTVRGTTVSLPNIPTADGDG
jgi:hypothetical protein